MKFFMEITTYESEQPLFCGEASLEMVLMKMADYGNKHNWDNFLTIVLGYSEDFNYLEDLLEFVFRDCDPFTLYIEEIKQ